MAFYSSISTAYDQLFPLNPAQVEFVDSCFANSLSAKRIIDAGCGTGSLAILLARRSAQVVGFDSDSKMIDIALEKQPQALNLKFKVGDFVDELNSFEENRYDGILCFGNTLVHLVNKNRIAQFIENSSKLLKTGGRLLMQIINYDRVLSSNVDSLPTLNTDNYEFIRRYHPQPDGLINFETVLSAKYTCEQTVNSVLLLPLKKQELEDMLTPHFSEVLFYGDFKKSDWDMNSFHLVIEVIK
jgi:2-polyprenyl-3-methyl-5-hydroxy-6-metoxy-1,4-benzoquinol methylase